MDINFTDAERVILANQYDILGRLDESNRKDYERTAAALRDGHSYIYDQVFDWVSPVLAQEKQEFVLAVLNLYSNLNNSVRHYGPDAGIAKEDLAWPGFDGNNESDLYSFSCALAKSGRYPELLGEEGINSHSHTLDIYKRMLKRSIEVNAHYPLNVDQAMQILDARRYPGQ
ncbi:MULTISPECIES: YfbU family protein [unclassified Duganella]|uniref:YfbU family protein n=1 Tax=unclassified Duganella TaxID=2636909 RepID=UPI000887029B|nr:MULTISPECIES: YfbU family protein [unclassified Duganella]SDG83498.1 hypothetical protein SAMN05216320_107235 [Duganella sp. OV458]SDK10926.1 hypothetical protein SAMN05428973_108236 [Duganella sp. OV510]